MSDPLGSVDVRGFYETHIKRYGTGLAGAAFGLGWWAWADAVIMSDSPVGFVKVRRFRSSCRGDTEEGRYDCVVLCCAVPHIICKIKIKPLENCSGFPVFSLLWL